MGAAVEVGSVLIGGSSVEVDSVLIGSKAGVAGIVGTVFMFRGLY